MPERCAPTTAIAISPAAGAADEFRERRLRVLERAERQPGRGVEFAPDRRQRRIFAGRRQQRDAERRAVGPHRGRHRQPAQIEQVDEIGVGAEPAVELDRIGEHLVDRVDRRRRRQHQRVDGAEGMIAHAAQLFELIKRAKASAAVPCAPARMICRVTGCMDSRRRGDQRFDGEIALGDPRPLVEQPRRLVERLDVDFDDCSRRARQGASAPHHRRRPKPDRRRTGAGREAERRAARPCGSGPTARTGRGRENGSAASGPAITFSIVIASSTVSANTETQSSVRQAGTTPAVETRPRLGLRPTILLKAAGTRPEPAVSVPSASGAMPAPTASAEPVLDPPGMSFGSNRLRPSAVGRAHADETGRELIEIGLAENERARLAQPRDGGGVLRRAIGEGRTGRGGRQAVDVDIVLHRDRNAVERQRFVAAAPASALPRQGHLPPRAA